MGNHDLVSGSLLVLTATSFALLCSSLLVFAFIGNRAGCLARVIKAITPSSIKCFCVSKDDDRARAERPSLVSARSTAWLK